jgi:hypothetical protein
MFQITVPTRVELVVPLNPLTQTVDVFGGVTKSSKELEMHDVAPPSTKMSKESESKMAREDVRPFAADWARATSIVRADCPSMQAC